MTDPVLGDGTASYTPGVSRRQGTSVSYQHGGLKNLDAHTSVSQNVTAARIYDAFGNVVTSTGAWAGPFGYAGGFGYQQDASGLKLLGHRYYDPSTGRFLTRDPIKDGRNWYAYGAGEAAPTNGVDPDGLQSLEIGGTASGFGLQGSAKGGVGMQGLHGGVQTNTSVGSNDIIDLLFGGMPGSPSADAKVGINFRDPFAPPPAGSDGGSWEHTFCIRLLKIVLEWEEGPVGLYVKASTDGLKKGLPYSLNYNSPPIVKAEYKRRYHEIYEDVTPDPLEQEIRHQFNTLEIQRNAFFSARW